VNVSVSRSRTMSAIRGKNTRSTERTLRMALTRAGIKGWRLHANEIIGNPDIYFPKCRLAVFVDGCFWHGCTLCGHIPRTRGLFWAAKIRRNRQRDRRTSQKLQCGGTKVLRIWEHSLRSKRERDAVIRSVKNAQANTCQKRLAKRRNTADGRHDSYGSMTRSCMPARAPMQARVRNPARK